MLYQIWMLAVIALAGYGVYIFVWMTVLLIRDARVVWKRAVSRQLPTVQEILAGMSNDKRQMVENFLKQKSGMSELEAGDMSVLAMLSKFTPEHWDMVADYIDAGLEFGGAASYVGLAGRCVGFDDLLEALGWAERRYADHGFVPISIELFEDWYKWGKVHQVLDAMGRKNRKRKSVVLYSAVYKQAFPPDRYQAESTPLQETLSTGEARVYNVLQPSPDRALASMSDEERANVLYIPSFR